MRNMELLEPPVLGDPDVSADSPRPVQDAAWLETVYTSAWKRLVDALISQRRLTPEAAEDVAEEAFRILERKVREATLPVLEDPFAYLYTTAKRLESRLGKKLRRGPVSLDAAGPDSRGERLASLARGPASTLFAAEDLQLVLAALDGMPPRDRAIVERYFQGTPMEEIARDSDLGLKGAYSVLERSLEAIRAEVGRYRSSVLDTGPKPRTRKAALEAIRLLPREYAGIVEDVYIDRRSLEDAALRQGLSPQAAAERLRHGEEILARRFDLKLPDELSALLDKEGAR